MELKKILVPVDFTPCSTNALKYAAKLAKKAEASLLLVHTYDIPATYGEVMSSAVIGDLAKGVEVGIEESFKEMVNQVPELEEVDYETKIKLSPLAHTVESMCQEEGISLVVVGTRGAHGIKEFIVGSNTYTIVKETSRPVLVIPENGGDFDIRKIALASDYKKVDLEVLLPLKWLVQAFGAELHILHVSEKKALSIDEADEAKKFELLFKDVQHHYHLIVNSDVEKGLESYNEEHQLDMLALVPRKHSLVDRVFGGSESKKLIFHTNIPLLAMPQE